MLTKKIKVKQLKIQVMKTLEQKISQMIEGEKKRRSVAIEWLNKVTKTIFPVMVDLFGDAETLENTYDENDNTLVLKVKETTTNIYFRYISHYGEREEEGVGFYTISEPEYETTWGDPVKFQKGNDFWRAVRTIMDWLPEFENLIESKGKSRNNLVSKLLVE